MFLAHSADKEKHIPFQSYLDHVTNVSKIACNVAKVVANYMASNSSTFKHIVKQAAELHDLGKLDDRNQKVLSGLEKAKKLPVQHTDAGTAFLIKNQDLLSAVLCKSHHIGLPDWSHEENRGNLYFRDNDEDTRIRVDETVDDMYQKHINVLLNNTFSEKPNEDFKCNPSIFLRMALSCLVDGDHTDTALHYENYPKNIIMNELKADERLLSLNNYISKLNKDNNSRNFLRSNMYYYCRDAEIDCNISSCDSPVGTGKTTSVMAHLLSQAKKRNLRRIFIVLPFVNIISQSVDVYRKSLVLPGEDPEDIVAELHYRADYDNINSRHLTALWQAPIIVTTAVTFFETLSSNTPSSLRRLHNLPGSAIFIDESHAALPVKLYPLAWKWMKSLANEWSCYWNLASGSLNRFWNIPEFDKKPPIVPEIVPDKLRTDLAEFEINRINYKYIDKPFTEDSFINWIENLPGPRIVIVNTVQSAAVIALKYKEKYGRHKVEHLSTALTSKDRGKALKNIIIRLDDKNDTDWTFIATSCVEAGVDISFKTGVREVGSLVSLLQTSGRVNRSGEYNISDVWSINFTDDELLIKHPSMKDSSKILKEYLQSNILITPDLCTDALKKEIRMSSKDLNKLIKSENDKNFPEVEKEFKVIDTDTRIVVIDKLVISKIEKNEDIDFKDIQKGSVQIWGYKIDKLDIHEFSNKPGLYKWSLEYDDFIGYMKGVLFIENFANGSSESWVI